MAPKTITIIGSLNMDLVTVTPRIPSGGETLTASSFSTGPGGKGANQAVATARLSCPNPSSTRGPQPTILDIKMIGAIGSDAFGPVLISSLQESFIDTTSISVIPSCSTGVAVILVEASLGENRILLSPGANGTLLPKDFEKVKSLGTPLPELVILQLEIPLQTVLQIIETAKKAGVPVLLNPAPAVPLPEEVFQGLDHLVLNESEAAILSGRAVEEVEAEGFEWDGVAAEFLRKGVKNLIITLGSKGAFYSSAFEGEGGKSGYVKAEKIKVVDTTAAGDTFVGAYAVQVVSGNGRAMGEIVKLACRAAGKTCEKAGAQAAIPWGDEVEGLL
ncbi:ribokinase-like protein [Hyaloscypha variabilis F]|uniref:Ribokinase n=1 Tax=Hyaloscypha variabilis (strain UAMH 11265 / GT02V1 / F) TaxID=1149755 RepID=A0A2J6RGI2_HYAVF|nr:ribokinase-like protein [Hyaloscypha variabilis F]